MTDNRMKSIYQKRTRIGDNILKVLIYLAAGVAIALLVALTAVDEDFALAILGTKGKWYDHTVSVRNAEPKAEEAAETPADGEYSVNVVLEGGSGRASVDSPAALTVADGRMTAAIVWSSPNYDYMIVDGEKYLPTNTEGNSTFEIPVAALGTPLSVVADTVAMSTPHEIEYTLTFTLN